jgi:hypothetical protein
MLSHLNFCIEWFDFKFKRGFKISFENALKYLKRKKKEFYFSSQLSAQLSQQAHARSPSSLLRFLASPCPTLAEHREPSKPPGPARARAAFSFLSLPSLTPRVHVSGAPPSSSRRHRRFP